MLQTNFSQRQIKSLNWIETLSIDWHRHTNRVFVCINCTRTFYFQFEHLLLLSNVNLSFDLATQTTSFTQIIINYQHRSFDLCILIGFKMNYIRVLFFSLSLSPPTQHRFHLHQWQNETKTIYSHSTQLNSHTSQCMQWIPFTGNVNHYKRILLIKIIQTVHIRMWLCANNLLGMKRHYNWTTWMDKYLPSFSTHFVFNTIFFSIDEWKIYFSNEFNCHFHRAITFYLTTTISAVILGIILVTTIRPGVIGSDNSFTTATASKSDSKKVYTVDTLLDLIR